MTKKQSASLNKFCDSSDLINEASVESFFVLRLLKDLGYKDSEIATKKSIQELKIPKGRKQENYRPDYIISSKKLPRWIIDAKGTYERVDNFSYQCAGYALMINRKYTQKPVRFYMLTNGLLTRVYLWDQEEAIMSLRFTDFFDNNIKYQALKSLLSSNTIKETPIKEHKQRTGHLLKRPSMDGIKRAFQRCHRIIWKAEKMSPQASFVAFAKLLFVKLWEDRRLRDNPVLLSAIGNGDPLPINEVRFSVHWINEQEINRPNPVDLILFRQLVDFLELEIGAKKRKRIFEANEQLGLSPGTVKRVITELEDFYLFGIDEDLNGRMFEAFLTATMRGQELGQYFTPRSITKLITYLADLKATPEKIEKVLDGCCGTGGFLIKALTEMRRQLYDNQSLTRTQRNKLIEEVANKAIFGIDAGKEPSDFAYRENKYVFAWRWRKSNLHDRCPTVYSKIINSRWYRSNK
ncbi:MAG TPA: N-6 DNA methylase [Saprospiraceae bacterium]|nr:N-6 DNA methylase [Saprospiraceae bacterium]